MTDNRTPIGFAPGAGFVFAEPVPESDMFTRLAAALIDVDAMWNPSTATVSKERALARAALQVLSEPDDAMEIAGGAVAPDGVTNGDCRDIFGAMIAEVLTTA